MENNLPTKYNDSLFTKIFNFFKNIFKKQRVEVIKEINNQVEENSFRNDIKVDNNNCADYIQNMNKEQFIEQFEKNPELLLNLTVEQLEKMDKYYDEILEEYEEKLKKLA